MTSGIALERHAGESSPDAGSGHRRPPRTKALSGVTQSFDQLFVIRTLQGLGFGGEGAAGAVLIGEIIPARHRGKAVGCVQSAYAVGWFAASLAGLV